MKQKFYLSGVWCFLFFLCLKLEAQNSWTQKANVASTRDGAVGFSIGSKGYFGTGYGSSTRLNDFWEYDPSSNVWTQKANFAGGARDEAVGFCIGTKGYVGTGYDGSSLKTDFYEYDPSTNSWTQKANFAGGSRRGAVGFNIGSKGYVGTGSTTLDYGYDDFYEYDPSTNSWTQKANVPGGRTYAIGFSIGSKGYVGTGYNDLGYGNYDYRNDFYEYDPSSNAWTQKTNVPNRRSSAVGFSVGCSGFVGTGWYGGSPKNDFWEYFPSSNSWVQRANFAAYRTNAVGFGIGTKGYVGTGWNGGIGIFDDFREYDPFKVFTSSLSSSSYCSGSSISVPFTSCNITFNSGNVFTAQLSDASGSFASPTNIGTLTSTSSSGSISATIPGNAASGYNYRIRVVSSNQSGTGADNGTNLTIMGDDFPWSGDVWTSRDQSIILQDDRQDWNYICENSEVHFNAGAASPSDYSIYYSTLSNTPYWDGYNMVFTMDPGAWVVFSVNVTVNGCPKTLHYTFFPTNCDYGMYSLAPNPATSDLVIYVDEEKLKKQKIKTSPDQVIQQVVISDKSGNVLRQQKYPTNTKKIRLNVSGLAPDIYVAKIFNGKNWATIKFIKK